MSSRDKLEAQLTEALGKYATPERVKALMDLAQEQGEEIAKDANAHSSNCEDA
jgi:hypothetical protein